MGCFRPALHAAVECYSTLNRILHMQPAKSATRLHGLQFCFVASLRQVHSSCLGHMVTLLHSHLHSENDQ